jgi:flagellin-specific chaperone FliS
MIQHLTKANYRKDPKMIDEIISLLEELNAGWKQIAA